MRIRVEHPIDDIVPSFSVFSNQLLSDNVEHRLFILHQFVSFSRIFTVRNLRMQPSAQRECEDETQGMNVDCVRWYQMRLPIENFGCEPSIGAKRSKCHRIAVTNYRARVVGRVLWQWAAAPEIGQFHHQRIFDIKNVVRLQVPMEDLVVVQMLHPFDDLAQNISQMITSQF